MLDRTGRRGLFLAGTAATADEVAGIDGVFQFAPLAQALPRCAGVVHQGGHGTTAATLQAGLPAVTLPMGFDQVVHGRRLDELGVGRMVTGTGDRIAAITHALDAISDPAVRAAPHAFGKQLTEEDGVGAAADIVERYC